MTVPIRSSYLGIRIENSHRATSIFTRNTRKGIGPRILLHNRCQVRTRNGLTEGTDLPYPEGIGGFRHIEQLCSIILIVLTVLLIWRRIVAVLTCRSAGSSALVEELPRVGKSESPHIGGIKRLSSEVWLLFRASGVELSSVAAANKLICICWGFNCQQDPLVSTKETERLLNDVREGGNL